MWAFLERLLDSSMFSPHGICLLWEPELIWLHVVSDAVIAASYFSIPFALAIVVSKRRDFQFGWIGWSFAAFIMACASPIFSRSIRCGCRSTASKASSRPSSAATTEIPLRKNLSFLDVSIYFGFTRT
jgi:hypothetical protein